MEENTNDKPKARSIESALKSSMDVQTLNNLISSLRIPVKKSKVDATHKLTAQMAKLRKKKGTKEQLQTNHRKTDRMADEISVIKKLNLDKVAKFALGNTYTIDKVTSAFKNDVEMKVLVRLSTQKPLQNQITKWRTKHSDWQDLAAYIAQHTGRRYKPKESSSNKDTESKPKFKHQHKATDLSLLKKGPPVSETHMDGPDSSYHSDSSNVDQSSANGDQSSDSKNKSGLRQTNRSSINNDTLVSHKHLSSKDSSVTSNVCDNKIIKTNNKCNKSANTEPITYQTDTLQISEPQDKCLQLHKNLLQTTKSSLKHKVIQNTNSDSETIQSKERANTNISSEMIVTKLNLEEFGNVDDDDISFIFKGPNKKTAKERPVLKKSSRPKSDFFITGDDKHSDVSEENFDDDNGSRVSGDESDDLNEKVGEAKRAMYETTFLGSLAGPAPKFKDYVAFRREKKGLKKEEQGKRTGNRKVMKGYSSYSDKTKTSTKSYDHKRQVKATEKKPEEKLHPSWEASKKRKLEQASLPCFKGKKITFAD